MTKRNILLLLFHPRYEDSRANKTIVNEISNLDSVTIRDMYELYPDFDIDIKAEQAELLAHDIIIWQHPFYWYNCPPLMKQWLDLVLEYGWAYGTGGNKLQGKWIMNSLTSAGTFEVYRKEGRNRFTYRQLLSPFDQTAYLCHMEYLPPFVLPGANKVTQDRAEEYAIHFAQVIHFLQTEQVDLPALKQLEHFNDLNFDQWKAPFSKTH